MAAQKLSIFKQKSKSWASAICKSDKFVLQYLIYYIYYTTNQSQLARASFVDSSCDLNKTPLKICFQASLIGVILWKFLREFY